MTGALFQHGISSLNSHNGCLKIVDTLRSAADIGGYGPQEASVRLPLPVMSEQRAIRLVTPPPSPPTFSDPGGHLVHTLMDMNADGILDVVDTYPLNSGRYSGSPCENSDPGAPSHWDYYRGTRDGFETTPRRWNVHDENLMCLMQYSRVDPNNDTILQTHTMTIDLTGDGYPDFIDAGEHGNHAPWRVHPGTGSGFDNNFIIWYGSPVDGIRHVESGVDLFGYTDGTATTRDLLDINGDGLLDLVDTRHVGDWRVWLNEGDRFSGVRTFYSPFDVLSYTVPVGGVTANTGGTVLSTRDMTGDGLPDQILAWDKSVDATYPGEWKVLPHGGRAISPFWIPWTATGAEFSPTEILALPTVMVGDEMRMTLQDVNADSLPDVVAFGLNKWVDLNRGSGFESRHLIYLPEAPNAPVGNNSATTGHELIDLDGDNYPDYIDTSVGNGEYRIHHAAAGAWCASNDGVDCAEFFDDATTIAANPEAVGADMLVEMRNETEGRTSLWYRPLTDRSHDVPFAMWVLAKREVDSTRFGHTSCGATCASVSDSLSVDNFTYERGEFSSEHRKFLGFRDVTVLSDADDGKKMEVNSRFERPSRGIATVGKLDTVREYEIDGEERTLKRRRAFEWECRSPITGVVVDCDQDQAWPSPKRQWTRLYHADDVNTTVQSTTHYNTWASCSGRQTGMPQWVEETATDAPSMHTFTEYACPSGNDNLVDRPTHVRVADSDLPGGTTFSESWLFYDDGHLNDGISLGTLTRTERWLDESVVQPAACTEDGSKECVVTETTYDGWGNPTGHTNARGATTTIVYDDWNIYPETVTSPPFVANKISYDYDEKCGTLLWQSDAYKGPAVPSHKTVYEYDDFCRLEAVWPPGDSEGRRSHKYHYRLGRDGVPTRTHIEIREPNATSDFVNEYVFQNALGQETQRQREQIVDGVPSMVITTFGNDARGQRSQMIGPEAFSGVVSDPEYRVQTGLGQQVTKFTYDVIGRLTETEFPDGSRRVTDYTDPAQVAVRNECYEDADCTGSKIVSVTDGFGRVLEKKVYEQDSFALRTVFTYDILGRVLTETQSGTSTTLNELTRRTYTYDSLGRLLTRDDPASEGLWRFGYDLNGNVVHEDDPKTGQSIEICYDVADRPREKFYKSTDSYSATPMCYPGLGAISYKYDDTEAGNYGVGRLTHVSDLSGSTTLKYDVRGRIIREEKTIQAAGIAKSAVFLTDYDDANRPELITYPNGELHTFEYDATGQITRLGGHHPYVDDVHYDHRGRPTKLTRGNGTTDIWEYQEARERLSRIRTHKGDPSCNDVATCYTDLEYASYRPDGLLGLVSDGRDDAGEDLLAKGAFSYDFLGRLKVVLFSNSSGAYNYDDLGRMLDKDGSAIAYHLTNVHAPRAFDGQPLTANENGNIVSKGSTQYSYSLDDRLEQVLLPSGDTIEFLYDYSGKKVAKIVNGSDVTRYYGDRMQVRDDIVTTSYFLSGRRVALNRTQADAGATYADVGALAMPLVAKAGGQVFGYLGLALILGLLAAPTRRKRVVGIRPREGHAILLVLVLLAAICPLPPPAKGQCEPPPNGWVRHLHANHLGSTVAMTNGAGDLAEQIRYGNYGEVRGRWNAAGNPIGSGDAAYRYEFTGYENELSSGLMYAEARFYDPEIGMFLTQDPVAQFPSPYNYSGWNPVNFVDPTGTCSLSIGFERGVPTLIERCGDDVSRVFLGDPDPAPPRRPNAPRGRVAPPPPPPAPAPLPDPPDAALVAASIGVGIASAVAISVIPGAGLVSDLYTVFDSDASSLDRALAGASFVANVLTADALPNFGAVRAISRSDDVFVINDGVRRAKAAEILGRSSVRAEVLTRNTDRVIDTIDIPIERLRSTRPVIDTSTLPKAQRFSSVLEGTRRGRVPPIRVHRGSGGTRISDVGFGAP